MALACSCGILEAEVRSSGPHDYACLLMLCVELQATIQFDSDFTATTMLHPSTYLNKVLVGSSQGCMQLWNVKTQYALECLFH